MVIATVYHLRVRNFATRFSTSEVSCQHPFHFCIFFLVYSRIRALHNFSHKFRFITYNFFTSLSANTYIMCNNVDRVWCISATWYCYMLNLGLHWPDTECSPSPEDDIPARVALKQERKITCIVTAGSLWKYTVSKAILRTLFRNKILQTARCTCKHMI